MVVAVVVVADRLLLDRLLGDREIDETRSVGADRSREGEDRDFEGVESPAGVAVGNVGEEAERLVGRRRGMSAEPALAIGERATQEAEHVVEVERAELEDLAAADERRDEREEGIGRRGGDEADDARLNIRQQHVLLGFVEAVQFVDEENRAVAAGFQFATSVVENITKILHAGRGRVEGTEAPAGVGCDQLGERRLAGSGGTVEDEGADAVGLEHPPQQLPFAEEVLLTGELVESPRPHAGGERHRPAEVVRLLAVEQPFQGKNLRRCRRAVLVLNPLPIGGRLASGLCAPSSGSTRGRTGLAPRAVIVGSTTLALLEQGRGDSILPRLEATGKVLP